MEPAPLQVFRDAFAAAFVFSVVNLAIRPIVLLMARPLGFIAVFVLGFLVNALALLLTSQLLPVFQVAGWPGALAGGLVFAAINIVVTGILEINDEASIYQRLIERQAGIMLGDNSDIPAFRWYDKDKQKLYASGSDGCLWQTGEYPAARRRRRG